MTPAPNSSPIPVLLDTDIGDDIDDALTLALTLASPEIELRGITTVFIDAPRRAALAQHLAHLLSSDPQIVAGCSKPLLQPIQTSLGRQFEIEHNTSWNHTGHAVDFIIESVMSSNARLTLVPIGPLTNIAVALLREPRLAEKCDIILMGGQLSCESAEWNISSDPEAAAIEDNRGAKISLVGLDVTRQCTLSQVQLKQLMASNSKTMRTFAQLIQLWQSEKSHDLTLNDPLALMSVFLPGAITWEERCIEIGLCGEVRGKTLTVEGEENAHVAVAVDSNRVTRLFMQRVSQLLNGEESQKS